jgi:hypothetical protein
MKLIRAGETLSKAASKAGMDEKTARKYRDLGKLPSQSTPQRWWRTRADIFQEVWPEVEQLLSTDPRIEAVTLFDHLCRKYEGRFNPSHLRTLQRRVKIWRALEGKPKEVFFPQTHHPGLMAQSDFTSMNDLAITIAGQPFDHLFYHFTLTFSNWEAGSICFSESFESLSAGLQNALWKLGAVPQEHRTDSLSAAVNNLSDLDEFTQSYKGLLSHYGLRASHNNPGRANENGDVEQSHYRFKKAVEQELLLRGSRNFETRQGYDEFLLHLLARRNASRRDLLIQEMEMMRPLPARRLDDYTRLKVRVSRNSTISVRSNLYSVNSQLIAEIVEVRLFSEKIEVWYSGKMVESFPRLRGQGKHSINYRHIIDSLVRKPGALPNYRWRSDLFPRLMFRVAWDYLRQHSPRDADKQYVKILHLAASESEQRVDEVLRLLVERGEAITQERVREMVLSREENDGPKLVEIAEVELSIYDALLESREVLEWERL